MSYAIANELIWMRDNSRNASNRIPASTFEISDHPQARLVAPEKTVFLAQVADDLQTKRDGVERYLQQQGYRVVPDDLYWCEPTAFREAVERNLAPVDLFVQLLSALSPRKPKGLPEGYLRCQLDLAKAAGKPILQWRDPDLATATIEDADHRVLLEEGVIAEPLEDFKKSILKNLKKAPDPIPIPRMNIQVFVARDQTDKPLAVSVR